MELFAAICALRALKATCRVTLYSDSSYLVDGINRGGARRRRAKGWQRHKHPNSDLWEQLLSLCDRHAVTFVRVKGYAGNRENEWCDALSSAAIQQPDLATDERYHLDLQARREHETSVEQLPAQKLGQWSFAEDRSRTIAGLRGTKRIRREGQPCRKCATPVIQRASRARPQEDRAFYYEYYLYCPGCRTMYMVEEAKRPFSGDESAKLPGLE